MRDSSVCWTCLRRKSLGISSNEGSEQLKCALSEFIFQFIKISQIHPEMLLFRRDKSIQKVGKINLYYNKVEGVSPLIVLVKHHNVYP